MLAKLLGLTVFDGPPVVDGVPPAMLLAIDAKCVPHRLVRGGARWLWLFDGLAALVVDGCELLRERHGLATVALSGGAFQNLLLLGRTVAGLEARGFTVLTHSRVPCNDGGISLGQAVVAAARDLPKS